ncbi:MAG: SIR2 family NAD-dependent protein deacylase [Anaerolineaceae bacterium]
MNPENIDRLNEIIQLINNCRHVIVFSGAGISTPSGIPDFRSQNTGLWTKNDPMEVASLTTFLTNPFAFFDWFHPLAKSIFDAKPNIAHYTLAKLEESSKIKAVITQNIDMLHQRAGSKKVIEVHGSIEYFSCLRCSFKTNYKSAIIQAFLQDSIIPKCPHCHSYLKPGVILFEELLPELAWEQAYTQCSLTDLILTIGTSLEVYPANLLPEFAISNHAKLIINTLSKTPLDSKAEIVINIDVIEAWDYLQRHLLI